MTIQELYDLACKRGIENQDLIEYIGQVTTNSNICFDRVEDELKRVKTELESTNKDNLTENCIACKYDETEDENGEHCAKCLGGNSQFEVDTEFINKCKAEDCISRRAVDDILTLYSDGNGLMDARGAVTMVRELPSVTPKKEEFEWCDTCKEYDQEKHCCHRWTKVIRNTVEEMKQEQEPRKGYLSIDDVMSVFDDFMCGEVDEDGTETFLEMLKDKAETEE